jgi:hypothetical protein
MKDDHYTCTVDVSPDEIDAGADITLTTNVTCPPSEALPVPRVSIRDHEGTELAQVELTVSDDDEADDDYTSDDIVVAAPRTAGEHVYRAVVITADKDGALHERASAEARFIVTPHEAHLSTWDVPATIVAGERFQFMVGVRCSAGCCLAGHALDVHDRDGSQIGTAHLGTEIWPGTEALYVAEVAGQAPAAAGNYQWQVKTGAWNLELPHAAGTVDVTVKVVNPPDCEVTIEAFDRETQTPIKAARVVMHPYRAITDENGVAKVKVTKGQYDILVSASKYLAVNTSVEVTADMITRAELDGEPPWEAPDEAIV